MSSVRSFVTPPKIGPNQGITLGILGDLGQTEDSAYVFRGSCAHLVAPVLDVTAVDEQMTVDPPGLVKETSHEQLLYARLCY